MPFNQRMFKGELSKEEYILYLCQQLAIFQAIERFPLPHTALIRCPKVFEDMMYEFEGDMREIAGSIRAIQKDEWADEANKALDFNISILDELQRVSESAGE